MKCLTVQLTPQVRPIRSPIGAFRSNVSDYINDSFERRTAMLKIPFSFFCHELKSVQKATKRWRKCLQDDNLY